MNRIMKLNDLLINFSKCSSFPLLFTFFILFYPILFFDIDYYYFYRIQHFFLLYLSLLLSLFIHFSEILFNIFLFCYVTFITLGILLYFKPVSTFFSLAVSLLSLSLVLKTFFSFITFIIPVNSAFLFSY